eukprot:2208625-Rhodomonas_salina.2
MGKGILIEPRRAEWVFLGDEEEVAAREGRGWGDDELEVQVQNLRCSQQHITLKQLHCKPSKHAHHTPPEESVSQLRARAALTTSGE